MAQHLQSPISREIQRLRHMRFLLASEDDSTPSTRVGFHKLQQRLAVQAAASKERNSQLLQVIDAAAGQQDSQSTVTAKVQLCALRAAYMALVNRTLPIWVAAVTDELEQQQHNQQFDSHSFRPYADWRTVQQQQQPCDIVHAQHSSYPNIAAGPQAGVQVTPAVLEHLTQTLAEQSVLLQHLLLQQQQQCAVGVKATSCTVPSASLFTGAAPNTSGLDSGKEPKWQQQQQPQAKALHLSVFGSELFAPVAHQQQPTEQQQLKVEADEQACMPRMQALQNCATEFHHEQPQQQELQEQQQQQRQKQGDGSSLADASMLAVPQCDPHKQSEGLCRDSSCSSNADKAHMGHPTSTGQVVVSGDDPADAAAAEIPACPAREVNTTIAGTLQQLYSAESSGTSLPSVLSPSQLDSPSSSVVSYGEGYAPVHAEECRQHVGEAECHTASAISGTIGDLEHVQESVVAAVQPAEHQGGAAARGRVSAAVQVSRPAAPPPAPPLPAQLPTAAKRQAETAAAAAVSGSYISIPEHSAANVCQEQQDASGVFAAAAAVAANTIAMSAVQTCAPADTPLMLRSVAHCAGAPTGMDCAETRQSASNTASVASKSQQLGLGSLTAGLEVSCTTAAAVAATPAAAGPTATRCSTSDNLSAGAAMRRTSSRGAVAVASAYPSTSVAAELDSTGATAMGPLSIAHSVLLSPATRLSLGAAGHDATSPRGRQSLSSESEVEGGSRRSIGAASTGSTRGAAVTRLAPALHVPADGVVPGSRKFEASSRNLSRGLSGSCSTAGAAAIGRHLSVAGIVSQLQQQQAVVKGPLTVNAPKLRTAPLAASKLLGQQQQSDTASNPPIQQPPPQLHLATSSRTASGATAVVYTQAQQVVAHAALAAPEFAAERYTNSTGCRATGGGIGRISAQGHNVAPPSNAHLMNKVLKSGLTDFDGSDSDGDEGGEVAGAPTAGGAVGIMGKAASAFESDEFD